MWNSHSHADEDSCFMGSLAVSAGKVTDVSKKRRAVVFKIKQSKSKEVEISTEKREIWKIKELEVSWTCINHQLNAQFLYSLIISITLYSSTCFEHRCAHLQEEIKLCVYSILTQSALNRCKVWQLTECDDTRYCIHTTFFPPEDEHNDARNMSRSIV